MVSIFFVYWGIFERTFSILEQNPNIMMGIEKNEKKPKSHLKSLCLKDAFSRLSAKKILRNVLKNRPSAHPYRTQV